MLKDSFTDSSGNLVDRLSKLLSDGLTLERFDRVRVGSCGHDDESDNGCLGTHLLETAVQS